MPPGPSARPFWIVGAVLLGVVASVSLRRRAPEPAPARVTDESRGDPVKVGKAAPAGSLLGEQFRFEAGVYHLPRPKGDPAAALKRLLSDGAFVFQPGAPSSDAKVPTVWLRQPPIEKFAPPSADALESFSRGLSDDDKRALAGSRAVTVLAFGGPARDALASYRRALAIVRDLRDVTGGLLWDEETRQVFTPAAWAARLEGWTSGVPSVVPHITIHSYRDGELIRLITLGMVKFALPDVVVDQVAGSDTTSMASTIDLACQSLLEGAVLREPGRFAVALAGIKHPGFRQWVTSDVKPNARRAATLELALGEREEGDPSNRLMAIVFPGPAAGTQARQSRVLEELFGAEDQTSRIQHDAALLAASARAKKAVLKHKPRYREGPPLNEQLMIKAPFRTKSGGNEWMWVEVTRWSGATISGLLRNDPLEVPGLRPGARVEVAEDSLFDYVLVKPDGSREGNETSKLIEHR